MADRILSPEEVAYRARYGQDTLQGGRQMAQAPRHWAQALAGALQMGLGGHYGANAAFQEKEGKASANKMLADALMGGAAPKDVAAQMMGNPWAADTGRAIAARELDPMTGLQRQKAQLMIDNARADAALNPLRRQKLQAEIDDITAGNRMMSELFGGGAAPPMQQPAPMPQDAIPASSGAGRFAQPAIAPQQSEPMITIGNKTIPATQAMAAASAMARRNPQMAKMLMDMAQKAMGETRLQQLGIDPTSVEGQTFLLTGKLPAKAYEKLANEAKKGERSKNIVGGLEDLRKMTDRFDTSSFESAVGPFQGSEPDSLAGAVPINIARAFGEISNWFSKGKTDENGVPQGQRTPSEVRSAITGATEALAAAIKPLIRAPGEGPWTNDDQKRLVSIVGDLPQASTKEEFLRRLNVVRDRVSSNFGLDIPFDAFSGLEAKKPDSTDDGWRTVGGRRVREVR